MTMARSLHIRAGNRLLRLAMVLVLLVFLPAGTLRWWQGWVFVGAFWLCSAAVTVYLAINDPQLLERRMRAGSRAEQVGSQKIIIRIVFLSFVLTMIIPAIDHRFGWSQVPGNGVIVGYVLIVLGFAGIWTVFRENTYGASTIQLAEGQQVISSGPYAIVRHPMYSTALVMLSGIPLALGSWWGLLTVATNTAAISWRLLDEERFLAKNLTGYDDYLAKVRFRLLPFFW